MWRCSKCGAEVEDDFEVCWSCSTARSGASYEEFHADIRSASAPAPIAALEVEQIAVLQAIMNGTARRIGSTTSNSLSALGPYIYSVPSLPSMAIS